MPTQDATRAAALAWLSRHGWEVTSILPSGRVTIARGEALYRARSPEEAVRVLKALVQGQDPAAARRVIKAIEGHPTRIISSSGITISRFKKE